MNNDGVPIWFWIALIIVVVVGVLEIHFVVNSDIPAWAKWLILT